MKNSLFILFLLFGFGAMAQTDYDAFSVRVDGLGCPYCAYGLEKKFKEFTGIADVQIEMETGVFNFTYPAAKALTVDQVRDQVFSAGYTPRSLEVRRADGSVETGEFAPAEFEEMEGYALARMTVAGNCGMCKNRIERAAIGVDGVEGALWDENEQVLTFQVKEGIDPNTVATAVAAAGHDTETAKAEKAVYKTLPGCCRYKRLK